MYTIQSTFKSQTCVVILELIPHEAGTAEDVSFLIDHLPSFLYPLGERTIVEWGICGVSLGGHSTWIALARGTCQMFLPTPPYLHLQPFRTPPHSRNPHNRVPRLHETHLPTRPIFTHPLLPTLLSHLLQNIYRNTRSCSTGVPRQGRFQSIFGEEDFGAFGEGR
jgi:hypothetical protein